MFSKNLPSEADVVIIGGGVIGCSIARELSKYKLKVVLLEKESDVGWGVTKGNMGIIHPFVPQMKMLKGKLCIEGNKRFDELARELDFPFRRPGLLIVALNWLQFLAIIIAYFWLKKHKVKVYWISRSKLRKLEPNVNKKAKVALLVPSAGVTDPVQYTIALAENAVANGVKILVNTEVVGIETKNNRVHAVLTDRGKILTRFVINAAGLCSDKVEEMIGIKERKMWHGKGIMLVFDKVFGDLYHHIMAPMPIKMDPRTKGGAIAIYVHGNPIWGPNLIEAKGKSDFYVSEEDIKMLIEKFKNLIPDFPTDWIIKYFAGVRAIDDNSWDFVIGPTKVKGFINASYILSPGLTASNVIAEKVIEVLEKEGLKLVKKPDYNPYRKGIRGINTMSLEELDKAIKNNAKYGKIVCLCEMVSEAEVIEAINRGAKTIDSIKFRTRAGMGRCQGGRCLVKLIELLHTEGKIELDKISLKGEGSYIFVGD